jgi:TetR/AcrR family transcriptional regulator, regulator of biofilm formation and stress response
MVASDGDPAVTRPRSLGAAAANWYICTSMLANAPTGARPRGTARRDALLDAVLRVVAEVGVDAVTHRRVAEAAGLPLASTTYWFESKEHLLTAALERAADRDIERLQAFLGETPEQAPDPVGLAVDAILGPNAGSGPSSRGWLLATYALMLEAARMPALRDVTARWTDAYLEAIPPLLAAAGSRHARSDAGLLLAAADGLLVQQLATDDTSDLAPQLRRLADALVKA